MTPSAPAVLARGAFVVVVVAEESLSSPPRLRPRSLGRVKTHFVSLSFPYTSIHRLQGMCAQHFTLAGRVGKRGDGTENECGGRGGEGGKGEG